MNLTDIFLKLYHQNVKLDVILNSILVQENIRTSFLLEGGDNYDEQTVNILRTNFNFKFTELIMMKTDDGNTHKHVFGMIITKKDTNLPISMYDNKTDTLDITNTTDTVELGKLLSYPCAGDDMRYPDVVRFGLDIYYNGKWDNLMAMMCMKDNIKKLKPLINQIKDCINIINAGLKDKMKIKIKFTKLYTLDMLIKRVLKDKLNKNIIEEIGSI